MRLTQLYITSHLTDTTPQFRGAYQNMAAYLTEAFTDIVKKSKLDFGHFNRLILEEGGETDLEPRGEKAFGISLKRDFPGFDSFNSPNEIHHYFGQKYLEGLGKFDKHFDCSTVSLIEKSLAEDFRRGPFYEKKLASRGSLRVIGRWSSNEYQVVISAKEGKETVIYSCVPDPFVIDFDINKVTISDSEVLVINKVREVTVSQLLA